jgi:hypothetical protein
MADEKSWRRADKVKEPEAELEDRERMTERALSAIRQTGNAAALDKCSALADQMPVRGSKQATSTISPGLRLAS